MVFVRRDNIELFNYLRRRLLTPLPLPLPLFVAAVAAAAAVVAADVVVSVRRDSWCCRRFRTRPIPRRLQPRWGHCPPRRNLRDRGSRRSWECSRRYCWETWKWWLLFVSRMARQTVIYLTHFIRWIESVCYKLSQMAVSHE